MSVDATNLEVPWIETNQRYLVGALAGVRATLERHAVRLHDAAPIDLPPTPPS